VLSATEVIQAIDDLLARRVEATEPALRRV
jgi:hypothetical protein